ncbi:MAG: hypothetical protein RLZZ350_2534 [Verrucomicrobiota bacterium]
MGILSSLLASLAIGNARADTWSHWTDVTLVNAQLGGAGPKLATDGTNIFYATYMDGVYRAALADGNFSPLPLTGFPLWDANTQTNGLAVSAIAATPQGTFVIAGSPVQFVTNGIVFNPPGGANNTLPVFYWWDETNHLWQASGITNNPYPYVGNVGNFSIAPDGSLWTCSGFYPYVYRSTNGGKNFTAFDINARVPTNYFPMPFTSQGTFGEIFTICAGWNNEVVIGTETGGFLHTTNNGVTWRSLDPNFTSTNSLNPLGRIGDGRVAGQDHYGNFLCANSLPVASPAQTIWSGVKLIGWNPRDNSIFAATNGLPAGYGVTFVLTRSAGVTYTFMNQGTNNLGGVHRALDGKNWSQFNDGLPSVSPNVGNAHAAGNCLTVVSNTFYLGFGPGIYIFDSTPPLVTNRPPVALPQNATLFQNSPTNLTLTAHDADGDALNFSIVTPPAHGALTGTPPDMTYSPTNNFTGLDAFAFMADDGMTTSAPVFVNLYVNFSTNTPSLVALTSPVDGKVFLAPAAITLTASASDPDGITQVYFSTNNFAGVITNLTTAPYTWTLTNLAAGNYAFSARAFDTKGARTWSAPVRVTVLPVAVRATISPANATNVAISWPLELDDYYLETKTSLTAPWILSPAAPLYFTNAQTVTLPMNDHEFFRLMRPR